MSSQNFDLRFSLPRGAVKIIAEKTGYSKGYVSRALSDSRQGHYDNDSVRQIRTLAGYMAAVHLWNRTKANSGEILDPNVLEGLKSFF